MKVRNLGRKSLEEVEQAGYDGPVPGQRGEIPSLRSE